MNFKTVIHNMSSKKRLFQVMGTLFIIIIVFLCIIVISKVRSNIMLKDVLSENTSVIWAQSNPSDEPQPINTNNLYYYELGGEVTLLEDGYDFFDIVLNNDGTRLLAFTGNRGGFEIVEYEINNRELTSILTSEQVCAFLKENRHKLHSDEPYGFNVQYYDNEDKISFIYDEYLMGYSKEEGFEVIYTFELGWDFCYSWVENEKTLLVCDGYKLIKYDIATGKKRTLIEQSRIFNFVLSPDESVIIYEDRSASALYRYNLKSGKRKLLCEISDSNPELIMSKNGRFILCHDATINFMNYAKAFIYIIDIENGEKYIVQEIEYGDGVAGVTWNR
ncbi:MAG: hypothetical protein NC433_03385 [Clostridiales bacterium]|nr:hypothetical protein [Clostridiales bacterium]